MTAGNRARIPATFGIGSSTFHCCSWAFALVCSRPSLPCVANASRKRADSFPTPKGALVSLQQTHKLLVQGCEGFAAIPTPPTGAGPYDLTVIYICR